MGDADFMSDGRAARPRWRDQQIGQLRPTRNRKWVVTPVLLWGVAAVLAFVSPFLQLFVIAGPGSTGQVRSMDAVDGWGNFGEALGPAGFHGPRFGIALWAGGFGLALLAVQRLRAVRRTDPALEPVTAGAAIGLPCFLAGVTGSVVLFVQSYVSRLRGLPAPGADYHERWGWCLWLSLASLVLAVAATTILFWPSRSATGHDEPDLDAVGSAGL